MAKTKNAPEQTADDEQPVQVLPQDGPDQILLDPSKFQEVILGSTVAEPLPLTFERVDC